MTYFPHYKHDIRNGESDAHKVAAAADPAAALLSILDDREASDHNGILALAAVLSIASDPKWSGRTLSSVKARLLKALPGWSVDLSVWCVQYLVSPEGARIHLPDGIIDASRIERSNTCYGEAAHKRLAAYSETRKRIPAIVEAMRNYVESAKHLHACCEGSVGLEYDPMTAAGIMASA